MSDFEAVIPDAAVEAAVSAWMGRKLQPGNWTQEDGMRAALEAAAPYLMAQAWDEGCADGGWNDNPYRTAKRSPPA